VKVEPDDAWNALGWLPSALLAFNLSGCGVILRRRIMGKVSLRDGRAAEYISTGS